jgi:hypothetical protein
MEEKETAGEERKARFSGQKSTNDTPGYVVKSHRIKSGFLRGIFIDIPPGG